MMTVNRSTVAFSTITKMAAADVESSVHSTTVINELEGRFLLKGEQTFAVALEAFVFYYYFSSLCAWL